MGDPVTMAVVGGSVGAAMSPKNPLTGALMGAAGGYGGGALLGAAAPTAGAGAMGANAMLPGVQGGMGALAGQTTALTGATAQGGLMGALGSAGQSIGKYAQQNPVLASMAMNTGMSALQPQQSPQPAGLMKGGGIQYPQISSALPQQPFMPSSKISLI